MSKHTPGPWKVFDQQPRQNFLEIHHAGGDIIGASSLVVCKVTCYQSWKEEQASNARLIAAAPQLLEALKMWADGFNGRSLSSDSKKAQNFRKMLWEKTNAAIRAAEGEE